MAYVPRQQPSVQSAASSTSTCTISHSDHMTPSRHHWLCMIERPTGASYLTAAFNLRLLLCSHHGLGCTPPPHWQLWLSISLQPCLQHCSRVSTKEAEGAPQQAGHVKPGALRMLCRPAPDAPPGMCTQPALSARTSAAPTCDVSLLRPGAMLQQEYRPRLHGQSKCRVCEQRYRAEQELVMSTQGLDHVKWSSKCWACASMQGAGAPCLQFD